HGLAGAGRRHEQDGSVAALDVTLELGDDLVLIGAEVDAHATSEAIGRKSASAKLSSRIAWIRSSPSARTRAGATAIPQSRPTPACLSTVPRRTSMDKRQHWRRNSVSFAFATARHASRSSRAAQFVLGIMTHAPATAPTP